MYVDVYSIPVLELGFFEMEKLLWYNLYLYRSYSKPLDTVVFLCDF